MYVPATCEGERVKVMDGFHETVLLPVPAQVPAIPDVAKLPSVPGVKVPIPVLEVAGPAA